MMETQEVKALIEKYKAGRATEAEQLLLETWYAKESLLQMQQPELEDYARIKAEIWNNLDAQLPAAKQVKLWPRIAVVAAAVAAIVFGVWFYNTSYRNGRHPELVSGSQDVTPGKNTATLTLPNGKTIQLSDAKTGVVVGTELMYNDGTSVDKQLSPSGGDAAGRGGSNSSNPLSPQGGSLPEGERNSMMLTASTPRGGTYQFTLPDGTQVWLNAASKISFPAQFSGATRKILLNGEAYFEVAKNKAKPFIVESNGQEVTVLGTHFNINAYTDESNTKTTLLEGAVKVNALQTLSPSGGDAAGRGGRNNNTPISPQGEERSVVLTPNQQATLTENTGITVKQVDAEASIAWKNGKFGFNSEEMGLVMRKVARWYNVEVVFKDPALQKEKVSGSVSRFANISTLLQVLEETGGTHIKLEGRTITISK